MARGGTENTSIPSAIDAEQAILGAILSNIDTFSRLPPEFGPEHFFEPFHARLFSRMDLAFKKGRPFDPIAGADAFAADQGFHDLGGVPYLALLMEQAPPSANAVEWAKIIIDTATKRQLLKLADEIRGAVQGDMTGEELVAEVTSAVARIRVSGSDLRLIGADEAIDSVLDYIDNPGGHASGILTGLSPLDDHLGPWLPGDLIIGAGRPGMGKSAFAGVATTYVAQQGFGVIEINAEMSVGQMWRRRMTAMAFQNYAERTPAYSQIRKRTIEYNQRQMLDWAAAQLRGLPIKGIKRSGLTLSRMRGLIQRQKADWERQGIQLGLVTVDHGGIIHADGEYRSRVDEQTAISGGMKEMADDLQVPMLVLLQLSRKVEDRDDKRPGLSDLRDSGSWEQDADIVIGFYREAYYAQREKEPPQNGSSKIEMEWATWDQRQRSPWLDAILLKVREGETNSARLWASLRTNTILGHAPADSFGGML